MNLRAIVAVLAGVCLTISSAGAQQMTIEQAREEGRKEVIEKNRGFFHFGKSEPIEAAMVGEFRGFGRGRTYVLDNGQEWKQTDDASLAGVRRTDPKVRIKPGVMGNVWYLQIEGFNTAAKVERVK